MNDEAVIKQFRAILETLNAHRDTIAQQAEQIQILANSIATIQEQIKQMFLSMANATATMGHGATVKDPDDD